jgi:hypothetical protein
MYKPVVLILTAVMATGTVLAQDAAEAEEGRTREQTAADTRSAEIQQQREALRDRMRRAVRLPRTTEEAREEGASEEQVREVLRTGRERGIPAGDMEEVLEAENEELRRGGGSDNFGAAVQEMKASGLRGRELADAIHAEQVARGMKKPKDKGRGRSRADEEIDDERSESGPEGKPEGKGKGKGKGKPEDKGRGGS